jgi:murein DD-endopeptidase MepM/ murein hydrolase activator NlpD
MNSGVEIEDNLYFSKTVTPKANGVANLSMRSLSRKKLFGFALLALIVAGLLIPQKFMNPVEGANKGSFNAKSFWYYPWGKSGTHKGVDIFAKEGTSVLSSTGGLVIFKGQISRGGNVVLILGPKWRLHYFAHLRDIDVNTFSWANQGEHIGTVGTTGNAKGKPPHLHYSIVTLIPYPWKIDGAKQGWKKMFYVNPIEIL